MLGGGIFYLLAYVLDTIESNVNNDCGSNVEVFTEDNPGILFLLPATLVANGVLAILIAARLLYAHYVLRVAQSHTGLCNSNRKPSTPYLTAMANCAESSAVIFVAAVPTFVAAFSRFRQPLGWGNSSFQPSILLTQLYVGSTYICNLRTTLRY